VVPDTPKIPPLVDHPKVYVDRTGMRKIPLCSRRRPNRTLGPYIVWNEFGRRLNPCIAVGFRCLRLSDERVVVGIVKSLARLCLRLRPVIDLVEHQLAHMVMDPNGRAYNRTFLPS
jgi:hypothetical protein